MGTPQKIVVTGAFGYSGKYIANELIQRGHDVITITNSPNRFGLFDGRVEAFPFNFNQPEKLTQSLQGVDALVNTYWVRFDHGDKTYQKAVANTKILFQAAKQAGVRRVVHVSITNPSKDSPLPYFSGKAELEEELKQSGFSYAILRPTVIFGREDILINNITWFLRHFPLFTIPGKGNYRLQPIYVEDLARLAADAVESSENMVIDAIGPETYTFTQLVRLLKTTAGSRALLFNIPPTCAYFLSSIIGRFVGDVVLTRQEVKGLMDDLLVTDSPPVGKTKLSVWAKENKDWLGKRYANELKRHYGEANK